jgi:dipeptidyl aminopeptidase/acylaminoacyl peptidase
VLDDSKVPADFGRLPGYDWLSGTDKGLWWVESTGTLVAFDREARRAAQQLQRDGVESGLHAYGGTPYARGSGRAMWCVSASTGHVWLGDNEIVDPGGVVGDLVAVEQMLLCIRERTEGDEIIAVDGGTGLIRVLHRDHGFLGTPRLAAGRLAWARWSAAAMPWDSCEILCADYEPDGSLGSARQVAGGSGESAIQPAWGPDGWLYFISDRSGWWNLHRWRDGVTEAIAPLESECAAAPWESGYATFGFLPDRRIAMIVQNGPAHRLVVVERGGEIVPITLPYTSIKPYLAVSGDKVGLIGASPSRAQEVALVSVNGTDQVDVVSTRPDGITVAPSAPQVLEVRSAGTAVTVLLYLPYGAAKEPTPLIVRAHPGPTHHCELRLDLEVQFFCSRGFAVADVDYRGSTGYGREFRRAIYGQWGVVDVEDCRSVAHHLLQTGVARPGAVFISGASAGGYTALRAVHGPGPFAAAVARSAIVDPLRWTHTAPRFQRPHAAILAHPDAKVRADAITAPVLLLHGDRDEIAPVADAIKLVEALMEQGSPAQLIRLPTAGHYLSSLEHRAVALRAELALYESVLSGRVSSG